MSPDILSFTWFVLLIRLSCEFCYWTTVSQSIFLKTGVIFNVSIALLNSIQNSILNFNVKIVFPISSSFMSAFYWASLMCLFYLKPFFLSSLSCFFVSSILSWNLWFFLLNLYFGVHMHISNFQIFMQDAKALEHWERLCLDFSYYFLFVMISGHVYFC